MIRIVDSIFPLFAVLMGFWTVTDGFVSALAPTSPDVSDFFEVHSISGHRNGDNVVLDFERSIHQNITMGFTVRVMRRKGAGWQEHCQMEAQPFEYLTSSVLPDPITLDWWTHGKCVDPPDDAAQIWTVWTPTDSKLKPIIAVFDIPAK